VQLTVPDERSLYQFAERAVTDAATDRALPCGDARRSRHVLRAFVCSTYAIASHFHGRPFV
jgi:hypothetical protein